MKEGLFDQKCEENATVCIQIIEITCKTSRICMYIQ